MATETDWIDDELKRTRIVEDNPKWNLLYWREHTELVHVDVSGDRVAYVEKSKAELKANRPLLLRHRAAWKMFVDAGFKTTDERDTLVAEYVAAMHKLFYLVYCERGPDADTSTA